MHLGDAAESPKGGWNLWAGLAATCLWPLEGVGRGRQGACAVRTRCQGLGHEGREGSGRATPGRVGSSALPRPSPAPGPGATSWACVWSRSRRNATARPEDRTSRPRPALPGPAALPAVGRAVDLAVLLCRLRRSPAITASHLASTGPSARPRPGRLPDAPPTLRLRSGDSAEAPAVLLPDAFPPLLLWSRSPVNLKIKALQSRGSKLLLEIHRNSYSETPSQAEGHEVL